MYHFVAARIGERFDLGAEGDVGGFSRLQADRDFRPAGFRFLDARRRGGGQARERQPASGQRPGQQDREARSTEPSKGASDRSHEAVIGSRCP